MCIKNTLIRTTVAVVAILMILSFPFDYVDATAISWSSSPQFKAPIERENSMAAHRPFFVAPIVLSGLPNVTNKPASELRRIARWSSKPGRARVIVARVGKSVGNGSCVQYARSQGFKVSGIAKNVPALAKKEGYTVDLIPEIGAIIVTSESGAKTVTGHVTGTIQKIDGAYAYITEQNYHLDGVVTAGWIDLASQKIVAFIHPLT